MHVSNRLRSARIANAGLFVLTGLAIALWVVNIPAIQARTGISNSQLGLLILTLGIGTIVGMQAGGWLSDRFGSNRAAALSVGIIAVAINGPGIATQGWHLAATLPWIGLGAGMITVAANDQAVRIEHGYRRPIMASFHGFFSLAGAAGAGLGALLHTAGASTQIALGIAAVGAAGIGAASVPRLLAKEQESTTAQPEPAEPTPTAASASATRQRLEPGVWRSAIALATLAFLLNLAEGTATDWSAVHAVEHLQQPDATASLAYAAFAAAMTVGRFTADRVVARVGPVAVVRGGSAIAALGVLSVTASPWFALTLIGWMVFGLGLSGVVPQLFTAAGNLSTARRGVVLSRVVGAGYVGMLAGPAIIGALADGLSINTALLAPLACCAAGIVLAGAVRPASEHTKPHLPTRAATAP